MASTQENSVNAGPASSIGYRPSLDGIRAIAVSAVLLYHGGSAVAGGGFLGVDIFFVLSGFLITSILLHEWHQRGSIDLKNFWLRRARRLLPALILVLVAVLIASFFIAGRSGETARADSIATFFYASNWWFVVEGSSYFDQFNSPSPLRHTWSLAIEEQWYLLFPLILIAVLAWLKGRKWLSALLLGAAVVSAIIMALIATSPEGQARAYYGTDTRIQALLVGAALAAMLTPGVLAKLAPYARILGFIGVVGVIALLAFVDETHTWLYQGGFFIFAVAVAIVLLEVTARPEGLIARGLAWAPLVWLGRISYGVYLWHWPIYLFLSPSSLDMSGTPLLILRVGVTIAIATLSYYFIEKPIRDGALSRMTPTVKRTVLIATPVALTVLVIGAFIFAKPPANDSLETLAAKATQTPSAVPSPTSATPTGPTRAVLVGDSNTLALFASFPTGQVTDLSVAPGTEFGCGVAPFAASVNGQQMDVPEKCAEWVRVGRDAQIKSANANLGVLAAGPWDLHDRSVNGEAISYTDPRWQRATEQAYRELITKLHKETGAVAVMTTVCNNAPDEGLPTAVAFESGRFPAVVNDEQRVAAANRALVTAAKSMPYEVPVIDLNSHVCPNGFEAVRDGAEMRTDGLHFSDAGGQLVWRWLGPQLKKARANAT